ncbi:DUF485 domain-containing protein [Phyllobacterium sp. SB3]|uniref:DUF485 domain-containing protein n=1 Tax=Phyllobacterium sp. SB3 TaxID=3156073 RepID=UPI0032AF445D
MLEHTSPQKPGEVFADSSQIQKNPGVASLIRRSRTFGFTLFAVTMIIYVGFFALVAFAPQVLAADNALFGSFGFLLVFAMFVIAWALTWFYLRQTTRVLEPMAAAALREVQASLSKPVGAS